MQNKLLGSILLTVLTLWGSFLYAQKHNTGRHGIELSVTPLSAVNIGPFQNLLGSGSHDSKHYISGLVRGTYKHTDRWSFSVGFGYSSQKVTTTSALVNPDIEQHTYFSRLQIWEVPLEARLAFLKYFYASAGPLLHMQQHSNSYVDKKNGLGINIGVGTRIPLSQTIAVSLAPHYKLYSLIPFQAGKYYDRIQTVGVEIGMSYSLSKH
ncbi:hypothetical protein [Sphingobacterium anhuiense]|uniref:hypothetical protein n=1 Tax=Sphingobacterium anhuiense TaxID=493780 RepID=UPI003C2E183C